VSPRSPHKSWHSGTALPICVGCNNSWGKSTLKILPNFSKATRIEYIIITHLSMQHPHERQGKTSSTLSWVATKSKQDLIGKPMAAVSADRWLP